MVFLTQNSQMGNKQDLNVLWEIFTWGWGKKSILIVSLSGLLAS